MLEKAEVLGMSLDRARTRRELELAAEQRPSVLERPDRSPSGAEVKMARSRIAQLRAKFAKVEAKATLDLLPALEHFNSQRMRERLSNAPGGVLGPVLEELDQVNPAEKGLGQDVP